MSASIKSLVVASLAAAHAYSKGVSGLQALPEVRKAAQSGADAVRTLLLPAVAEYYSVPVVVSESPRNKGQATLDREAPSYEAAKTALRRLTADVMGKGNGNKPDVEIPEELLIAARALVKRANAYEGAKSLAAKALALAFAE